MFREFTLSVLVRVSLIEPFPGPSIYKPSQRVSNGI